MKTDGNRLGVVVTLYLEAVVIEVKAGFHLLSTSA